ncbi:hypothetical protein [Amycolatopsis alkalitolerans]|uniref:DUF485 domain-containing protein n=1 Tax=Amycolatopsis alkalitolerans TaxID=2547244 RepID=A0A5C4LWB1_9PSEU|nr:hypothetical protein [Amycolatopsis alkalitolerans]TNC22978.1 hypothetical protein FG385_22860 [Amycolatopsis alkalitolerans]
MSRARRVAVTSPQTRLAHAHRRASGPWRTPRLDPAESARALSLYRRQQAPAVLTLTALLILLCGLPVVFALWPGLDQVRVGGIPLSWLMLGVLPFPVMVLLAVWQLRRAEKIEDDR